MRRCFIVHKIPFSAGNKPRFSVQGNPARHAKNFTFFSIAKIQVTSSVLSDTAASPDGAAIIVHERALARIRPN